MSSVNNHIRHWIYKRHNGDTLMSEVVYIVCVLLPRAVLVGGLDAANRLCIAHYYQNSKEHTIWNEEFFDYVLQREPILGDLSIIPSVFVADEKQVIIPEELYSEVDAKAWLKNIFFIEADETIFHFPLERDNTEMVFAQPASATHLTKTYFSHTIVRTLNAYQHMNPVPALENLMLCVATEEGVFASLRRNKKLLWHQYFNYQNAEDIAYQFGLVSKEHNIAMDKLNIQFAAVNNELTHLGESLRTYYPLLSFDHVDDSQKDWAPVIYLLQQLNTCAL